MKCMYCKKGNLKNEFITKSYEKEGVVTVITGVPILICDVCGQEFLEENTVKSLEIIRKKGRMPGMSMGVFNYSATLAGSQAEPAVTHE